MLMLRDEQDRELGANPNPLTGTLIKETLSIYYQCVSVSKVKPKLAMEVIAILDPDIIYISR
jgi:hypothetical protein